MPSWHSFRRLQEMAAINITGRFFQPGGPSSTTLLQVTLQITSDSECNSAYANFGGITDRMICAGDPTGGKAASEVTES
jgi:hypothetical protein